MPDIMDMPPLRLNLPTEGELSPSEINSLISTATTMRKMDLESKAAARRYRGQQQLQQLIAQGVPFDQALLRVSGDLMYQDPHGFSGVLRQMEYDKRASARQAAADARFKELMDFRRSQAALRPPPIPRQTPEEKAAAATASKKATQDFSVWNAKFRAAMGVKQAVQKARDEFLAKNPEANPEAIRKGLAVHGENLIRADRELDAILKQRPQAVGGVEPTETEDQSGEDIPPEQNPDVVYSNALSGVSTGQSPVVPAGPAGPVPPMQTPKTGRVRVKSATGKIGSIPANQLDQAIKEGYTPVP